MIRRSHALLLVAVILFTGCKPTPPDLKESLDGWEYITTFKIYPSRSLAVVEKRAKIILGNNSLLIVELEKKPIFKPNAARLTDLQSYRFLFVELSLKDSLVTPANLGNSRIIREIIAMSPQYGVNSLNPNEKIEMRRLNSKRWRISSELEDFQFEGEFSFVDSLTIKSKRKQLLRNE